MYETAGVKTAELVRRIARFARKRGMALRYDRRHGKGSHGRIYLGSRFSTVPGERKDIGAGLLAKILRDLGLRREDLD